MEPGLAELQLNRGSQQILNAENGWTFCIKVGEGGVPNFVEFPFISSLTTSPEPTISVSEIKIEGEEDDVISHEIMDAETSNVNSKVPEKSNIPIVTPKLEKKNLWKPISSVEETNPPSKSKIRFHFNTKKKKRGRLKMKVQNETKPKVNDVVSIVMKNMSQNAQKQFSGMKMMLDPKSGQYVIKSNYIKSSLNESFTVEPWMIDQPRILQQRKEALFLLDKRKNLAGTSSSTSGASTCTNPSNLGFGGEASVHSISDHGGIPYLEVVSESVPNIENDFQSQSTQSQKAQLKEGNMHLLQNYISLSSKLKAEFGRPDKMNLIRDSSDLTDYMFGINMYESPVATKSGAAPGVSVFLSWESAQERIKEIQEESMTRFIYDYKSPNFKGDPQPFKKIQFELDTIRKDVEVIIPNNGIPFIFLGVIVYTCHLGKKRSKGSDITEEDCVKPIRTKKIGCPAVLSISRIARFPDFSISNLPSGCNEKALEEIKDAWDFNSSKVRYYIEYHMKEPKPTDHKGHEVQYLVSNNRFKEPVDPRILEKIRDLAREGYTAVKVIQDKVEEFVREELFKGDEAPPFERRRYSPSVRDIRYAIFKAKEELKKEGKSVVQLQCSALANEISKSAKNISNEKYLLQLRSYLNILSKTVKSMEPLESVFLNGSRGESQSVPRTQSPRKTYKRRKKEVSTLSEITGENSFVIDQADRLDDHIEQYYLNVPEATANVFNAQLYTPEFVDMNPGLVDTLQPATEDSTVTEVYYYYPDGTCELASTPLSLTNVQA